MTPVGGQLGKGERAPDLIVPIVGFRGWSVDTDRRALRSTLAKVIWDSPEGRARCIRVANVRPGLWQQLRYPHQPPGGQCSCGYYAYYKPGRHYGTVSGAVVLTGRLQVHRDGMRAEHCRVVALVEPLENVSELVRGVADRWGVPVVPFDQLAGIAAEFGERMPEELRYRDAQSEL